MAQMMRDIPEYPVHSARKKKLIKKSPRSKYAQQPKHLNLQPLHMESQTISDVTKQSPDVINDSPIVRKS